MALLLIRDNQLIGLITVLMLCGIFIAIAVYLLEFSRRFSLMFPKDHYSKERLSLISDYISSTKDVNDMSKIERKRHVLACDNLAIKDKQLERWYKENNVQPN